MSDNPTNVDRVVDITEAIFDKRASENDLNELDAILLAEPNARGYYLDYFRLHVALRIDTRSSQAVRNVRQQLGIDGDTPVAQSPSPDVFVVPASSMRSSPFSLQSSLGAVISSYGIAAVFMALMLLGAWAYKINHDCNLALDNSRRATTSGHSQFVSVGRITGMKDCRWANPDTHTILGAAVALNREYALSSGLLEITYISGAKVILEGPCAFKVDSSAGGYLTRGKLTARVEAKGSEHSPLSTLHSPLFAVHTPTALVTDLGTEFGVEVDENGDTFSHVFQGSIKVQGLSASADNGTVLHENESIQVSRVSETHHDSKTTSLQSVRFTHPTRTPVFVRNMPKPPPVVLLCDDFECENSSNTDVNRNEGRDYELNTDLGMRQSGSCKPVLYVRGGDLAGSSSVQVNHPICPDKMNVFTEKGYVGWVALNRNFPRDVRVAVELDPNGLCRANPSYTPSVPLAPAGPDSDNWMALGIRGRGAWLDQKELTASADAGAVFQIRVNGRWGYYENGKQIAEGRVSPELPYNVEMLVVGDRMEIQVNGVAVDLDADGPGTARALTGLLAQTKDNYITLGAGNVDLEVPGKRNLYSVDNLHITAARRGDSLTPAPDTAPAAGSERKEGEQ